MYSGKSFLIGALAVSVAVLGYLYYQETQNTATLKIQLPSVKIN
jgi:hypothetical protein